MKKLFVISVLVAISVAGDAQTTTAVQDMVLLQQARLALLDAQYKAQTNLMAAQYQAQRNALLRITNAPSINRQPASQTPK